MIFSITFRYGIPFWLKDTPADHGDDTGHQDHGGSIVLEQIVNSP